MNTVSWSDLNDIASFAPKVASTFVCETCSCGEGKLAMEHNCVVFECSHMKLWLYNNEVVRIDSKGSRS